MERLDKLVSSVFGLSRREAQAAVRQGRVEVSGAPIRLPETKVDPAAPIALDGEEGAYARYVYIMLDKPAGYVSATEDSRDPTVLELLPELYLKRKLGVAGRLDKDATGLLLLTDDGTLNHRLTSPRYHLDKRYDVRLDYPAREKDVRAFAEGMDLGDFTAMPGLLEIDPLDPTHCFVTIREGKFHQVKRMFEKCGRRVLALRRVAMGGLLLDETLGEGGFRLLTAQEIQYLTEKCAIKQENQK